MSDDEYFGRPNEGTADTDQARTTDASGSTGIDNESDVIADLTLVDIERLTGISYVTLQRYAQSHNDRLPHEGTGRNRRYYPSAVEEFQRIKAEIAERRKGAGTGAATGAGPGQQGPSASPRTKKKRKKRAPRKAVAAQPTSKGAHAAGPKAAAAQPKPEPVSAASAAPSDLDRLAHTYQLTLQLKTLDAVQEFVSEWRAKLEAELATLKGI